MPSLHQIDRLITLGTARYGHGAWRYPNVHEALIAKPSLLLERLLALLPSSPTGQLKHSYVARLLALLFGQAERVEPSEVNRVRSSLAAFFRRLTFVHHASSLYTLLDDRVAARGVKRILGNDFSAFYEQLWSSASELGHFDSLVNLDNALDLDGRVAPWADRFVELTDDWLRSEMDVDDLTSSRDYYWTVSEHLDLKDLGRATEWDELVEGAERESAEVGQPEDYSWRVSEEDEDDAPIGRLEAAMDPVDALFEGLVAAARPEQQSVP